ncbi:MAG: beta strand repeat-containing protein [Clostridium sp.]
MSTLPSPNPIKNSANLIYSYFVGTITNTTSTMSTVTTTTVLNAIIAVNKIPSDTYRGIGDTISYSIVISNTGNASTNGVYFIDTLPNGTTLVSGTFKQDGTTINGDTSGVTLPNQINALGVSTVTFEVLVYTIPSPNPIVNNASLDYNFITNPITGDSISNGVVSNSATTTINYSILASTKSVDTSFAQLGTTLTYRVVLTNTGTSSAGNILLIDTIPSALTFVPNSFVVDGITLSGENPNPPGAYVPTIPANYVSTVTFMAILTTIPTVNPLQNSASTSYKYTVYPTLPFGQGGNSNTGTATTTVVQALINVSKTSNKNFALIGDTITYTITLINIGNTQTNSVYFIDTIPNGTTFVSGTLNQDTTSVSGDPSGVYLPNQINGNSTSTVTFQVVVISIPTPNPIQNQASVNYSFITNPITGTTISGGNVSTVATSQVNDTTLTSVKLVDKYEAEVGDTVTYTVVLTNIGSVSANEIRIIDTIPQELLFVNNSFTIDGVTISGLDPNPPTGVLLGTIPSNSISTITFQTVVVTVPTINPIYNSAFVDYRFTLYPTLPNGIYRNNQSNIAGTTIVNANITAMKFVDNAYATCGETITYTIVLSNVGNVNIINSTLYDTIPSTTIFIANSVMIDGINQSGVDPISGINISTIAIGEILTISFKAKVQC